MGDEAVKLALPKRELTEHEPHQAKLLGRVCKRRTFRVCDPMLMG